MVLSLSVVSLHCVISGAGGESDLTKAGRIAHENFKNKLSVGYVFNKAISATCKLRPDAIDWANRIVRELKPATASGIKQGTYQLNKYVKALEKLTGEKWIKILDLYTP